MKRKGRDVHPGPALSRNDHCATACFSTRPAARYRDDGQDHDRIDGAKDPGQLQRTPGLQPDGSVQGGWDSVEVHVHRRTTDGVDILDVEGELDIYTSPKLRTAIQELLSSGKSRLVVNLLNTTYLDSTALSVLTSALKQARDAGGTVALVYNQPQIEKIFTITGLHEVFPVFRTEREAVGAALSWTGDKREF